MPFYRFRFQSSLPATTVTERIRAMVSPPPTFGESIQRAFGGDTRAFAPFIGAVDGPLFHVRRDIRYRNSFLPRISGRIAPIAGGSRVDVTMYMNPFVALFMLVWFSLLAVGIIHTLLASGGEGEAAFWRLVPLGMFLFGLVLCLGGFFPEAIKARRMLVDGIAKSGA